jgi:hypothetical protein
VPSLRAHMVFVNAVRDGLAVSLPDAAAAVASHWPSALLGSEAPDGWYLSGETRPETHGLDLDTPTTWAGAASRWLVRHPALSPGQTQPAAHAAFLVGYFSHVGLDTWEQYQHPDFPPADRARAPAGWFPDALASPDRRQAALRALGEHPFPAARLASSADLTSAPMPPGFPEAAIRQLATRMLPALPLTDPWRISLVNPLRPQPDTPEAHARWLAQRSTQVMATPEELATLLHSALALTLEAIHAWWQPGG